MTGTQLFLFLFCIYFEKNLGALYECICFERILFFSAVASREFAPGFDSGLAIDCTQHGKRSSTTLTITIAITMTPRTAL